MGTARQSLSLYLSTRIESCGPVAVRNTLARIGGWSDYQICTLTRQEVFYPRQGIDHFDKVLHALVNTRFQLVNLLFYAVYVVYRFVIRDMLDRVWKFNLYEAYSPMISFQMNLSR